MSDIYCAKCGEPWDAYGVRNGDMEPHEAKKFMRGQGCPCCDFGRSCVSCGGTGKANSYSQYDNPCPTCNGMRKVLVRRLCSRAEGRWDYGFIPNVRRVPIEAEDGFMRALRPLRESRDGLFEEAWFRCWSCDPPPCEECGGDGKLHRQRDDMDLDAARSECDASDEDPAEILIRRGLL